MTEPELHTDEAHAVIAAELVACTLGQRHRPELRTDFVGALARYGQAMVPLIRSMEATMRKVQATLSQSSELAAAVRGEGVEPPTRPA